MRWELIAIFALCLVGLFLFGKYVLRAVKRIPLLVANALLGTAALYLLQLFGAPLGLQVTANALGALLCALLGVPGLALTVVLQGLL